MLKKSNLQVISPVCTTEFNLSHLSISVKIQGLYCLTYWSISDEFSFYDCLYIPIYYKQKPFLLYFSNCHLFVIIQGCRLQNEIIITNAVRMFKRVLDYYESQPNLSKTEFYQRKSNLTALKRIYSSTVFIVSPQSNSCN